LPVRNTIFNRYGFRVHYSRYNRGAVQMKKVIIAEIFDEIEELNTSLRELTDFELVDCRQSLIQRTNILMSLLDELSAT
jgi:phage-related holin